MDDKNARGPQLHQLGNRLTVCGPPPPNPGRGATRLFPIQERWRVLHQITECGLADSVGSWAHGG